MNNKFISLATAATLLSLGFSACNKDDQKIDVVTPEMANAYAKVSINMPKGTQTRADNPFDAGSEDEAKVSTIYLALYDAGGNYVGSGQLASDGEFKVTTTGETDKNVSDQYTKIFQIDLLDDTEDPTQVVAFINCDLQTVSLTELNEGFAYETFDETGKNKLAVSNNFPMTNSGYYDQSAFVMAVEIEGDLYDSFEEASEASAQTNVTIYVERLAAKISVDKNSTIDQKNLNYEVYDVAGNEVTLEYTPTNWAPTGMAMEEYIVKTPFENYKSESWVSGSYRSYWAEGVGYKEDFGYYYKEGKTTGKLKYVTFGDLKDDDQKFQLSNLGSIGTTAQYAPEHTTILGGDNENLIANTYALIVGKYTLDGENAAEWFGSENINFYLLLTGHNNDKKVYTIYNKSQIIGYLLHQNGVQFVGLTPESITQPTEMEDNDFDFTQYLDLTVNEKGQYILATKENAPDLFYNSDQKVADNIESFKTGTNSKCYYYESGAAYFNALIKHAEIDEKNTPVYGVVRNHSYKLTISKIVNLGAPIDDNGKDPKDPIIPDPDELNDHFIKAEINVLSWHIVENDNVIL